MTDAKKTKEAPISEPATGAEWFGSMPSDHGDEWFGTIKPAAQPKAEPKPQTEKAATTTR